MSSINLKETEAQHRSALITAGHYQITLDVTGDEFFESRTVASFTVNEPGSTFLDLRIDREGSVEELLIDGHHLPTTDYDETQGVPLNDLEPGDHIVMVRAKIPYSRTGEGLHKAIDPADGKRYLYTQFETADAKRVFACFDQPDMKATYDIEVTAKEDDILITNEPVTTDGNVHRTKIDYLLPTYLIGLCIGPYFEVTDTWTGELTHHPETPSDQPSEVSIDLGLYCRASIASHLDSQRLFQETKQGFDFFHRNFGVRYPFTKYDQIFVPEFNAGAMENAGCVTIRDEYVFTSAATHYRYERRAETLLHEMAHMWFGNLVTMKWWGDLWLNESFATWAAAISQAEETEYDTAWVTFANIEKAWAYQQDQLPTTHPISTDASDIETVEQNFDGITYAKGASVLKQLQAYVGRENFFAGVRRHFVNHAWSNATFEDLLNALEEASGRDLSDWAGQWLTTTGINALKPVFSAEDGKYASFAVSQSGAQPGAGELRTHRIAVGLYKLQDGATSRVKQVEIDIEDGLTEVSELIGEPIADLVLVNDDDLTYCLMELDHGSMDFVLSNLHTVSDPMARTLCWSAAWQATREGTMRARDFVSLVAHSAHAETEMAVLERILAQAVTALTKYCDPTWAQEHGKFLLADALTTGSQQEDRARALVYRNTLTKTLLTEGAAEYLRTVYNSEDTDPDLKWSALTALISHGYLDDPEQEIDLLAASDNTASGHNYALKAKAAMPTAKAKQAAISEVLNGALSNLETRHVLEGFRFTDSTTLLSPFNSQYFELAEKLWREWSNEMATSTLSAIFPSWNVSKDGIKDVRHFLDKDLPGGLRRLTLEHLDNVERMLRLRDIDAS